MELQFYLVCSKIAQITKVTFFNYDSDLKSDTMLGIHQLYIRVSLSAGCMDTYVWVCAQNVSEKANTQEKSKCAHV